MAQIAKLERYDDGNVVLSNLRNNIGAPVFAPNSVISASRVMEWWDGTPMTDAKVDGQVYFKLKKIPFGSDTSLNQYVGDYFKVDLPNEGELFLEKDTMQEMRDLNSTEILLLQMGYYRGVKLNGYYENFKFNDPVRFNISNTVYEDDGGSVIEVGGVKFTRSFDKEVDVKHFGAVGDGVTDDRYAIQRASDYCSRVINTRPVLKFPFSSGYAASMTVYVDNNISIDMDSPVISIGSTNKRMLVIGREQVQSFKTRYRLRVTTSEEARSDWSDENQYVGITLINCYESDIVVTQATFFTQNLIMTGDAARGNAYNTVILGEVAHGLEQISLESKDGGWCNSNKFIGGRLWVATNIGRNSQTRYGVVFRSSDGYLQNNNTFDGTSFEFRADVLTEGAEAIPIKIENGRQNFFKNIRDENNTVTAETYNNSFSNYVHCSFTTPFGTYKTRVRDLGLFPTTVFSNGAHGPQEELGWLVYDSGSLRNKMYSATSGVTAYGDLTLQNTGSSSPTVSISGATLNENSVSIPTNVGVGVVVDSSKRKRFNVAMDYEGEFSGRLYVVAKNDNGDNLTSLGTVRISSRYGDTNINEYGVIQSSFFGGSFTIPTGTHPNRDLGAIMQYVMLEESVARVEFFIVGYQSPAIIKSFQVYSLDGSATYIPYRQVNHKIRGSAPEGSPTFSGDFVFSSTGTRLGWKGVGSQWVEIGANATFSQAGVVKQSAIVDDVAADNGVTDSPSTASDVPGLVDDFNDLVSKYNNMVALCNSMKTTINQILSTDRSSGQRVDPN